MTDREIVNGVAKFFDIKELVSKRVYDKYGNKAWQFLCPRALHTLLILRKELGSPITINNWSYGGKFGQRGLRSNLGHIFLSKIQKGSMYLSGHVLGKAFDLDVEGMTANEVRKWIVDNEKKFPYSIRLERKLRGKYISWVHFDVIYNANYPKIYLFDV